MKFETNLIFLIKPFCYIIEKATTKTLISWEGKELLKWNKKHFSSFLTNFQLLKLCQTWECAFNTLFMLICFTPLAKSVCTFWNIYIYIYITNIYIYIYIDIYIYNLITLRVTVFEHKIAFYRKTASNNDLNWFLS